MKPASNGVRCEIKASVKKARGSCCFLNHTKERKPCGDLRDSSGVKMLATKHDDWSLPRTNTVEGVNILKQVVL